MAQSQPQVPSRTSFSPSSQMSPSPVAHPSPFSGQPPPAKKPRLSPAPSSGSGMFSPMGINNGVNSNNSPDTPGTPNSAASPGVTLPPAAAVASQMPSSAASSASPSPITTPSALLTPVPLPTVPQTNGVQRTNGNGAPTSKLRPPVSQSPTTALSPKPTLQTPTPPTPAAMTPSSAPAVSYMPQMPHLPQLAPTPSAAATVSANTFVPVPTPFGMSTLPGATMGPPMKPVDRPTKEYQYDVDDSLAGTGIDLRQEEQFQAEYFAGSFRPEARTGFPANAPGRRDSFYGALSANQPAETLAQADQRRAALEIAKEKWTESAQAHAKMRGSALQNRFLSFQKVHERMEAITGEYGIGLVLDPKPTATASVRLRSDAEFPKPQVIVRSQVGPDGVTLVQTKGLFLPEDSYLADQLALLSLATKHRIRELLEDANKVAVTRQSTSHGAIPEEWLDAAAPLPSWGAEDVGVEDSGTEPLKYTRHGNDLAASLTPAEAGKKITASNTLVQSLRVVGRGERSIEEQRLRKRQKREASRNGEDVTAATSGGGGGSGGTAPSTPGAGVGTGATGGSTGGIGGTADTSSSDVKAPTKKELKKTAAARMEQNDTMSANRTSMAFLGGRKKQYSWLSGGAGGGSARRGLGGAGGGATGNVASSPGSMPGTPGAPGSGVGTPGRKPGDPETLTADGRTKWGAWREDGLKGKDIQLRDLVVVLEADGREIMTLQKAYTKLDGTVLLPASSPGTGTGGMPGTPGGAMKPARLGRPPKQMS